MFDVFNYHDCSHWIFTMEDTSAVDLLIWHILLQVPGYMLCVWCNILLILTLLLNFFPHWSGWFEDNNCRLLNGHNQYFPAVFDRMSCGKCSWLVVHFNFFLLQDTQTCFYNLWSDFLWSVALHLPQLSSSVGRMLGHMTQVITF